MNLLQHVVDTAKGKIPHSMPRSDHWPKVRLDYLKQHPTCALCGGIKKLEVHHIRPFHLHPNLELDPTNFITLCEDDDDGINCHLFAGHLGNFKSWNVDVGKDASYFLAKVKTRPLGESE